MPRSASLLRWAPALAWMALISYWSHQSTLPIDRPSIAGLLLGHQHAVAHVVGFGVLGLLAWWAQRPGGRSPLVAVLVVAAFGAVDELHQSLVPGREGEAADWLLDVAAATGALALRRPAFRALAPAPRVLSGARARHPTG